ncbi:MAG TPA: hypothetical protein VN944_04095 [Nitrospiria bacterium]|nr:hypothetical protein [Nitrospiria bacterium]
MGDVQGLPIVYVVPAPYASAPINTRIEAHFVVPLEPSTLQPGLFFLLDSAGNRVDAALSYTENNAASDYVISLTPVSYTTNPPAWLNPNAPYTVILGGGIRAKDGSAQTFFSSWSFQTKNTIDVSAPTFRGILSATGVDTTSVRLTWGPAIDNPGGTPSSQLIFSICMSTLQTRCQQSFSQGIINPQAVVDSNGNYSYLVTTGLNPDVTYYFVVRVADMAGNMDQNTVQLSAATLPGKLYASNFESNEILGIDHPSKLGSNTTARSIQASNNGIIGPYGTFFDQVNKRLFVSSCQSRSPVYSLLDTFIRYQCVTGTSKISIYNNATTLPGGDQVPDLVIQSSQLNGPMGLYYVNSTDTLYVANFVGGNVAIIKNIASCVSSPCTLAATTVSTGLTAPFGVAYDTAHSLLYVTNYISVFSVLDTTTGTYNAPVPGTTLLVFNSSGTLIKTVNQFQYPAGLWLDSATDTLYIANAGPITGLGTPGIIAICNASLLGAGVVPFPANPTCSPTTPGTQYLTGTQTALFWPVGMATTPAGSLSPALYVSDYLDNSIKVYYPVPLFNPTFVTSSRVNVSPLYTIKGISGEVLKPVGVSAGTTGGSDYLMTADLGRDMVLFFDNVPQNYNVKCPPIPPSTAYSCLFPADRVIAPTLAGITGIYLNNTTNAAGMVQDRLYAANYFNNSIAILDSASTLSGNAPAAIYKVITSPGLQNPYGIFVDTSQGREWIYALNGTPDNTGMNGVLVFDTTALTSCTTVICNILPARVIHSADFHSAPTAQNPTGWQYPAGIWVDEGIDVGQTAPRDILYVSIRGDTPYGSSGAILVFKNSSSLNGSVAADKIIQGANTTLLTPGGLFFDPALGDLYVANEARQMILVFNQPQACVSDPVTRICDIAWTRSILNSQALYAPIDTPAAVTIDLKTKNMFVSTLGIFNNIPSFLQFGNAIYLNGDTVPSAHLSANDNSKVFLNKPLGLAFDNLH